MARGGAQKEAVNAALCQMASAFVTMLRAEGKADAAPLARRTADGTVRF